MARRRRTKVQSIEIEEEVIVSYEYLDQVMIKNLAQEPRQFHLRNGVVLGCVPQGVTTPFLKKHISTFLRKLEKDGKIQIIPVGGA